MWKKICGIYCLSSPSGKSYIGQSVNILKRFNSYKNLECKSQKILYRALKKYGFDNFKKIILEECADDQLNDSEVFWINYLETRHLGYNIREGGSNGSHSNETKLKISKSSVGRIFSDETKLKMSKSQIGINKGVKKSKETRLRMSVARKGKPVHWSDKSISRIRASHRKKWGENWGIIMASDCINYHVRFNQNKINYRAYGFPTIELAKEWRDNKVKELELENCVAKS